MKYLSRNSGLLNSLHPEIYTSEDDPLSGVANLFDIGLVFIVGLIITLFTAYHLQDIFNTKSEMTILKKTDSGQVEVIIKKGKKIKVFRASKEKVKGKGQRLGVAYKLEDGTVVYVPD